MVQRAAAYVFAHDGFAQPAPAAAAADRDEALLRLASSAPLAPGRHLVTLNFAVDGPGFGRGGVFTIAVDGRETARTHLDRTVAFKFSAEDAAIGRDTGTPVSDDYSVPFAFGGPLRVTIALGPTELPD